MTNPGKLFDDELTGCLIDEMGFKKPQCQIYRYYANIEDKNIYEHLRQDLIKTENQLMAFYDSKW